VSDQLYQDLLNEIDYDRATFKDRQKALSQLEELILIDEDYEYFPALIAELPFSIVDWDPPFEEGENGVLAQICKRDDVCLLDYLFSKNEHALYKIIPYALAYGAFKITSRLPSQDWKDLWVISKNLIHIGKYQKVSSYYFKKLAIKINSSFRDAQRQLDLNSEIKNRYADTLRSFKSGFIVESLKFFRNTSSYENYSEHMQILGDHAPLWMQTMTIIPSDIYGYLELGPRLRIEEVEPTHEI